VERHAFMHHRGLLAFISSLPHATQNLDTTTPPIGGEVPRLVALEGQIDASGK
jgi:hypothetical protein